MPLWWLRMKQQCGRILGLEKAQGDDDEENPPRMVVPSTSVGYSLQHYCLNEICTTKYKVWNFLPKNLWEQFHRFANIHYLFIAIINWIPEAQAVGKEVSMLPLLLILAVTAIKDALEDYRRYLSDTAINKRMCSVYNPFVDDYVQRMWSDVRVGDILKVENSSAIPADLLLLHSPERGGIAYIETANLDGETTLKPRYSVGKHLGLDDWSPLAFRYTMETEWPTAKLGEFAACVVMSESHRVPVDETNLVFRGAKLRNTQWVEGVVVYTGHDTKVMQNSTGPRYKVSRLEREINETVKISVALLVVLCLLCGVLHTVWTYTKDLPAGMEFLRESIPPALAFIYAVLRYIILLQTLVPFPLYITIEVVKLGQVAFMQYDIDLYDPRCDKRLKCNALNIQEDLAKVEYLLTDKTGTLTENRMELRCLSVSGRAIDAANAADQTWLRAEGIRLARGESSQAAMFLLTLCVCNTVLAFKKPKAEPGGCSQYELDTRLDQTTKPRTGMQRLGSWFALELRKPRRWNNQRRPMSQLSEGSVDTRVSAFSQSTVVSQLARESGGGGGTLQSNSSVGVDDDAVYVTHYEAESPDEIALVSFAASRLGVQLVQHDQVTAALRFSPTEDLLQLEILHYLHFSSERRRMSVIVRDRSGPLLLVKGADSAILPLCVSGQIEASEANISAMAKQGLRTLVLAYRRLSKHDYAEWQAAYDIASLSMHQRRAHKRETYSLLEQQLTLVGVVGIEDRLQPNVPETLAALSTAGIKTWMITGDKLETAVGVGTACGLIANGVPTITLTPTTPLDPHAVTANTVVIVEGDVLTAHPPAELAAYLRVARAVICCRATPGQKETVTRLVNTHLSNATVAIGDGANDVSMIYTASVGIAVYGQEGLQAVLASDYAVPQFQDLTKLLLVHGHWSYYRISKLAHFTFFKSLLFVFLIVLYEVYNGFSGMSSIEPTHLMLFNSMYTTHLPIIPAIFSQPYSAATLLARPELYRGAKYYRPNQYISHMLDGLYQAFVIFYVSYGGHLYIQTPQKQFGFVLCTAQFLANIVALLLIFPTFTLLDLAVILFTLTFYFSFGLAWDYLCVTCQDSGFNSTGEWREALGEPRNWLIIFIALVICFVPRVCWAMLQSTRSRVRLKTRNTFVVDGGTISLEHGAARPSAGFLVETETVVTRL